MKVPPRRVPAFLASASLLGCFVAIVAPTNGCGESETGGHGGSSATGGAAGSGAGGTGGCGLSAADCPPGSANAACLCVPDSMPCFGLDEAQCKAHQGEANGDLCEAIYGSHDYMTDGEGPQVYLGCMTNRPRNIMEAFTCGHPKGEPNNCAAARESDLPDGWVECKECECAVLTQDDCRAGSGRLCCCADFPDSQPCEDFDEYPCENESLKPSHRCAKIMGKVWDPTTQQEVGSEIYLGCRSTCVPEKPHGEPTCVHPSTDATTCDVTTDGRIPDGWSTDCSACASPQ